MTPTMLDNLDQWLTVREGFPRPDWRAIRNWIDANVPEAERPAAWLTMGKLWLEKLRERLGPKYRTCESDHFLLLSSYDNVRVDELLNLLEDAFAFVYRLLAGIAVENESKAVVLAFNRRNEYIDYISDFFPPEGEFAVPLSFSAFHDPCYGHVVMGQCDMQQAFLAVPQQLTHGALAPLPLPRWLMEGLAGFVAREYTHSTFHLDTNFLATFRPSVSPELIQRFWSGVSFGTCRSADEAHFSYQVAEALVRRLAQDMERFKQFVIHARREDAGKAATEQYLGKWLEVLIEELFGPGEWAPAPKLWET